MTRRSLWEFARRASVRVMKNLIWGGAWGLFFGVVYCVIGLLLRVVRGARDETAEGWPLAA
ncbi:MAG: hypothetical protein ACREOJ_18760, partial [Gemmatimonadaceae bacterium]